MQNRLLLVFFMFLCCGLAADTRVPVDFLAIMVDCANQESIRADMVIAIAKTESAFNPQAVSSKGACGLMQLMPETAARYGVMGNNIFDVEINIKTAIKHLKYLIDRFNRNIPLVLAAYNAGEGAVEKYKGIPPYRETINYVHKVLGYMGLGD